jgi:hypothetical protein
VGEVDWDASGRVYVENLSGTGGREMEDRKTMPFIWRPCFLHQRKVGTKGRRRRT